ncbi:acyl-CoA dehydrogenase family protein [Niallia circulans]|uniref:Acyl-CoA dehydrogenase family protein n=1 Tax=Niallia circulans TaxID=1397 RepID=A0A941GJR1_NIACI|nr:acyl-CoA dehydrogenase family protein [Niallia circulans]MCB5236034.1 acyl-CoA dehydrogenase family protein [Niallia circulans]
MQKGGSFLTEQVTEEAIFTPEDFTEEHHMIAEMTSEFVQKRVLPHLAEMENHQFTFTKQLMEAAGELGLLSSDIPEIYGGLGLDKISTAVISEMMSVAGGFSVTHGAHIGIGSLPIVLFGNKAQKEKYLPDLATGKKIASYALTEPTVGSDALSVKTTAVLNNEGTHYLLTGEKQWITNSGIADIFIVYTKVNQQHFTAFIVEKAFSGVSVGKEENKLGIKSSSTCAVRFDQVEVPVENVLGEVGRGHLIALNILNIGRYKLGLGAIGASKEALKKTIAYTDKRIQFSTPISRFPLTMEKYATMASYIYAAESTVYRTAGLLSEAMDGLPDEVDMKEMAKIINEYVIECSLNKIFASEVLDMVVDEGVQLHGGNGFMEDYDIARMYRDSRINRIFEGTNEINRLLIPPTLAKKSLKGELPLLSLAAKMEKEMISFLPEEPDGKPLSQERMLLSNSRKISYILFGMMLKKYKEQLEQQQEIMVNLANIINAIFSMDSCIVRTQKAMAKSGQEEKQKLLYTEIYCQEAFQQVIGEAIDTLAYMLSGDELKLALSVLKKYTRHTPKSLITSKREAAKSLLRAGEYQV